MKKITQTTVKKTITHDCMKIVAKYPSGASFSFIVNRNGERLKMGFSNDLQILALQTAAMREFIELKTGENNAARFDRLENLLKSANSGLGVMASLTNLSK